MNLKIISGGQTGADETALEVANEFGIETGGFAPKGYKTERGPNVLLRTKYKLEEASSDDYTYRTGLNVQAAKFTVWIGKTNTPGYKATEKACKNYGRDLIVNPSAEDLVKQIRHYMGCRPLTVNFAGNRESKNPAVVKMTRDLLIPVFKMLLAESGELDRR